MEGRWRSLRTAWRNSPTLLFLNKFGTLEGTGLTVAEAEGLVEEEAVEEAELVGDAFPEREEVALGEAVNEDVADNERDSKLDGADDNRVSGVLEGVADNETVWEEVGVEVATAGILGETMGEDAPEGLGG